MPDPSVTAEPYWAHAGPDNPVAHPRLAEDLEADVAIVGAGIVGLSAAEILARAGKSVIVLEALRVGTQVTARSTAKISSQHGLVYHRLVRDFGRDEARLYAQANEQAIRRIAELVEGAGISCSFERKSAYLYAQSEAAISSVRDEAAAAIDLGLPAQLTKDVPAPVPAAIALRFDDQAQFNPVRYLAGLATIVARSARLFETTRVSEVRRQSDGHYVLVTEDGHRARAGDVILATHLPIVSDGMFFARAYPFSHPMVAAQIDPAHDPDGMFISADEPTHSFRTDASGGSLHLIAVGRKFSTGDTEDETSSFHELEEFLRGSFGVQAPAYRWTNEDFRSMDGLPFIGPASSRSRHLLVATGFNAWGITNGTLAATLLSDLVLGRDNPCAALFDPGRRKPLVGGAEFLKSNLRSAGHLVGDRFRAGRHEPLELPAGQATITKRDGETMAAYRDDAGNLHAVSAVCTHMGCLVGWNAADRTWDCPCHGSRFDPDGAVLHGPATAPLKALPVLAQG